MHHLGWHFSYCIVDLCSTSGRDTEASHDGPQYQAVDQATADVEFQRIRWEQDVAFEESLWIDRQKYTFHSFFSICANLELGACFPLWVRSGNKTTSWTMAKHSFLHQNDHACMQTSWCQQQQYHEKAAVNTSYIVRDSVRLQNGWSRTFNSTP